MKVSNVKLISKKILFAFFIISSILPKYYKFCLLYFDQLCVHIHVDYFYHILTFFKSSNLFLLNSLLDIVVTDLMNFCKGRFKLNYIFLSITFNYRIHVEFFTDGFTPIISISQLYPSSNWLEREAWDMFGIKFLFHPNLRRILTDYSFKGHPLRKDFPLIGYTEIFYNDSIQNIQIVPVELTQNLRFYSFLNPWARFKN